ncbi:MAG: hypothetical protein EA397_18395 [Deltaproteobacteria bacterium]|nr:MAG: hypothetical protein EA397_18395 [Deltaproteobacteria bacterium]
MLVPLCAAALNGCIDLGLLFEAERYEAPSPAFESSERTVYTSSVTPRARGISFAGDNAVASMMGYACGIDPDSGHVFFDIAMNNARIEDAVDDPGLVLTSLAVQVPLVHMIPVQNPFAAEKYLVKGVERAKLLSDDGFLALTRDEEGCRVRWYEQGVLVDRADVQAEDWACEGDLGLAVAGDRAYVSSDAGLVEVGATGAILLAEGPSVVAATPDGAVVFGQGSELSFFEDGLTWTLSLGGPISHVAASSTEVVAMVQGVEGSEIVRVSPQGRIVDSHELGFEAVELAVSRSGDRLAVSSQHTQVYYLTF